MFKLQISCMEVNNCTPMTHIICKDGHIFHIQFWFNTDPANGCMPFDFDWDEFDTLASQCHQLTHIVMRIGADLEYVTEFAEGMARRLKGAHRAGKLTIFYEGTEDEDVDWHTWEFKAS
ncbi:uncharacterized protein PHACADRAFT_254749 [Phanerochaete carnosa HHB-10118-sp]|uniref:Uncharacterized protein n=1 Tax=Phanerochaete carnosa (strain HHB-10118-sp) TaxID=650164 RepID=K5WDQ2_PHACS|nr:uncharacterized protein PHACADRAFT_254749 [Phanerochaete carnosa HHB-10118-sp]EKM57169.1 hypothetical protein PHACADRAFT_254749 [Phanerochaete carnosa HHB-10118-sp]